MRKFIMIISALLLGTALSQSTTVTSTPGGLNQVATNVNETSLTVQGSLDARDFRYIVDQLTALRTLDLQGATIVAYSTEKPIFGNEYHYQANVVPIMALAGHQALQTVNLPATATAIGPGAFAGCPALTTITFPAELTSIGDHAFAGCQALTTVTLPAGLARLGDGAFMRCKALTTVQSADGSATTLMVGNEAFMDCNNLTAVTLSNRMAAIGDRAFAGTGLQALDLLSYNQLKTVGEFAFVQSQLNTIKFPANVTTIGRGALLYTNVTSTAMPQQLKVIAPFAFAGSKLGSIDMNKVTALDTIGDFAFYAVTQPQNFIIPSTTAYIGSHAMDKMSGLTEIYSRARVVPALGEDVWQHLNQANITLRVPNDAIDLYRAAEQWKEFLIMPGYIRGDANNDGVVDIGDVNAIINRMLNKPSTEEFLFEAADTDGNGLIDIDDVNYVINVILHRIDNEAPAMPADTDDLLTIDDFTIEVGQTRTVAVRLSNPSHYTAMQFDIVLPEGLTLADDGIAATSSSADHLLASATDEGNVRIVCYSLQGKTLAEGDAVVQLSVEADNNLNSDALIAIENGVLGTASSAVHHCEPSYAHVTTTTAVDDVNAATSWRAWGENHSLIIESNEAAQAQLVAMNGMSTTLAVMPGRNEFNDIEPGFYVVRIDGKSVKVVIKN